ncbi:MAG: hypothetical protein RJA98_812 [Pseudomonadota bacterium]|jgi:DNA polymerase-3 subunit epsilon
MPERRPAPTTYAVIDFETTGMTPAQGARATEVAAVLLRDGEIVGRYQNLMNSGAWVPPFIEHLTGISNRMLRSAPPADVVMREVLAFTEGCALVAHNAAFDRGFWLSEAAQAGQPLDPAPDFACTVLLSRRLYPEAPSHKLSALADFHHLPRNGRAHRAMSDAEVTAHLLARMLGDVSDRFAAELGDYTLDHSLLCALQRTARTALPRGVARHCQRSDSARRAASASFDSFWQ